MKIIDTLNISEKKTFKLHLFYSVMEGVASGALILNEFIFIKSLKGSNVQLAFLFQFSMVVFLFAMLANELMRRYANRKKLLRISSIVTRLPLIGFAFFPNVTEKGLEPMYHYLFLAVFLLFYTTKITVIPSINQYLKGNYQSQNFGRLFGFATTANKVAIIAATFIVGMLLEYDANSYRWFYPAVGVLGVISVFQLTKMEYVQNFTRPVRPVWSVLNDSFKRIWSILKFNKPFRHLEYGFMLYGFAWMSTHAVITIFYKEVLDLNYSSVAFYNYSFNIVAIIFLPLFGKLIGKRDPRRFGILTFGALLLFIFFTGATEYFPFYYEILGIKIYYVLMIAIFFNGLFMGSMPILWGIGSSYFCKSNEAADFQSVHMFLTGLRALFAPIIGIQLYELFGFSVAYLAGIILLVFAILLMMYSERFFPKKNNQI